jgi:hypothetical protein
MKSVFFGVFISLIGLFSCTSSWKWEYIDIAPMLHDHNSKIWLIDKLTDEGKGNYPLRKIEKMALVFYSNGRYAIYPVTNMGQECLEKGKYEVKSASKQLIMITENGIERNFAITFMSERVVLKSLPDVAKKQGIELIPFPEF